MECSTSTLPATIAAHSGKELPRAGHEVFECVGLVVTVACRELEGNTPEGIDGTAELATVHGGSRPAPETTTRKVVMR